MSPKLTTLPENYLKNRKQQTIVNGAKSSMQNVGYGVPQGSALGTQLFSLYIDDIVNHIILSKIQMYADDIVHVLYTTVENNLDGLRADIDQVAKWCNGNELTVNIDKTKYQIFPKNKNENFKSLSDRCTIKINQIPLKEVKLYKYLGVEIDNLLTMKQHANNIIKIDSHKLYMLGK